MKVKLYNPRTFLSLVCLGSLLFTACGGRTANPFSGKDKQVEENIENLMGLAVGMTKNQVYELCGVANYIEGYDWGSVWFYQYRKGNTDGPLAKKEIQQLYMPVVYDNTDRVTGYGQKFYEQTLSDLGSGQF